MKIRLRHIVALCLLIAVSGCAKAKVYYPGNGSFNATTSGIQADAQFYREKVKQLEHVLVALSETVDKTEAMMVAETAVRESAVLAEEYQLVRPAVAHNLLIALGLKDRGLCYHWTEDLMKRLQALDLKSLQLYWGWHIAVANCANTTASWLAPKNRGFLKELCWIRGAIQETCSGPG